MRALRDKYTVALTVMMSLAGNLDLADCMKRLGTLVIRAVPEMERFRAWLSDRAKSGPSAPLSGATDVGSDDEHAGATASGASTSEVLLDWRHPTVGWLVAEDWHRVAGLQSSYAGAKEYAHTLSQVWVLLTFYWGSGALWPRCHCGPRIAAGSRGAKPNANANAMAPMRCDEPLLCPIDNAAPASRPAAQCTQHGCSNAATWRCHREHHDRICRSCLRRRQEALLGPPGVSASTDVYDALVEHEMSRHEGIVYVLSSLRSRKPPSVEPHWNSTYRLQPSALVAVVKLAAEGQSLGRGLPLQWAEVVKCRLDPRAEPEWKNRQAGRLALRFLTRGDLPSLLEADGVGVTVEKRSRVAIIDLRVFVPEVRTYTAVSLCARVCTCIYVCACIVCVHVWLHPLVVASCCVIEYAVCVCVCMYVCVCVCVCVYVCVCVCVCQRHQFLIPSM